MTSIEDGERSVPGLSTGSERMDAMASNEELVSKLQDEVKGLEVSQATQAATLAGAQATQAAAHAGVVDDACRSCWARGWNLPRDRNRFCQAPMNCWLLDREKRGRR
jgi:hypothetical protein